MNTPGRVPCPRGLCVLGFRQKKVREYFGRTNSVGPLDMCPVFNGVIGGEVRYYAEDFVGIRARPTK